MQQDSDIVKVNEVPPTVDIPPRVDSEQFVHERLLEVHSKCQVFHGYTF